MVDFWRGEGGLAVFFIIALPCGESSSDIQAWARSGLGALLGIVTEYTMGSPFRIIWSEVLEPEMVT